MQRGKAVHKNCGEGSSREGKEMGGEDILRYALLYQAGCLQESEGAYSGAWGEKRKALLEEWKGHLKEGSSSTRKKDQTNVIGKATEVP